MAKITYNHSASEHFPEFTETIEVRVWGVAGTEEMPFYIGSGVNYQSSGMLWLEIFYSVEGAQIFYTRSLLQHDPFHRTEPASQEKQLDGLVEKGEGVFEFGDMLPETRLRLTLKKLTYTDQNDEKKQSIDCKFNISTDTGAVFGRSGPGERSVDIELAFIELEDGVRFMREMIHEIDAAQQGKHPDPATFPEGSSEWPLIGQLNRQAYNKISEDYQEDYFKNPLLVEAFDGWMAQLPPGGRVCDAGCGHGDPVIGRLLEHGFQVTGSDLSPEMLRRAGQQFPQAALIHSSTTQLTEQAVFDGICSFNSLLYLDPIDLLNGIYRLHLALKPGGRLFLYSYDSGPDWRGEPFGYSVGQWMWSWHYGMQEAAGLLEEHGYFQVLETRKVQEDPEEAQRIAQEMEKRKQKEEEYKQNNTEKPMPFPKMPIERSPYAYVISARKLER